MLSYPLHTHTLPLHCRFFCTKIDQSAKNHSSLPETTLHRMYPCEEKNVIHYHTFESNLLKNWGEGRWLGVVLADSGARGLGFEPHDRHVVSLSKTL